MRGDLVISCLSSPPLPWSRCLWTWLFACGPSGYKTVQTVIIPTRPQLLSPPPTTDAVAQPTVKVVKPTEVAVVPVIPAQPVEMVSITVGRELEYTHQCCVVICQ